MKKSKTLRRWPALAGVLLGLALGVLFPVGAWAAGIVVNTTADAVADDGECTLREAIIAANTDTASGGTVGECAAGSGADTITFAADYLITLTGSQLPIITTEISIIGNGEANTILQAWICDPVTLPGGCTPADHRVLQVDASGTLTLEEMTVRHGREPIAGGCAGPACDGGGIFNSGTLSLTNVTLSRNEAARGGGLNNAGTATLQAVTISGNEANNGGGVYNQDTITISESSLSGNDEHALYNEAGNVSLTRVDISGNSSGNSGGGIYILTGNGDLTDVSLANNEADNYGGGIYLSTGSLSLLRVTLDDNHAYGGGSDGGGGVLINFGDPISLTNVTFSGNSAPNGYGGGIMIQGGSNISLSNVSFSGNAALAGQGGGLFNVNATPTLTNVVLADSPSGGDCVIYQGVHPLDAASSNNLIEDAASACGLTNGTDGNIIGTDPMLGALADNGGFTQTMALPAGSAAIDAGTNSGCPATDQREAARPVDGDGDGTATCDIGAFEFGAQPGGMDDEDEEETGSSTPGQQLTFGTNNYYDGRLYVIVPASSIPSGYTDCRIQSEIVGDSGAFGFALDDSVWEVQIVCNGEQVTTLAAPITVCIRPADGVTGNKHIYHRHSGASAFGALPDVAAAGGYVCGTTTQLSLFTLGVDSLPATGFTPGRVTQLAGAPASYAQTDLVLSIPQIGVNASIVGVPKADGAWDVSWLDQNAGYLADTAFPTLPGNTVITAHVWDADGSAGIFARLDELAYGERFSIRSGGQTYTYEVRGNELYSPASSEPLGHEDYDWVTLITCEGFDEASGQYLYRRAVRAVLVSVD